MNKEQFFEKHKKELQEFMLFEKQQLYLPGFEVDEKENKNYIEKLAIKMLIEKYDKEWDKINIETKL